MYVKCHPPLFSQVKDLAKMSSLFKGPLTMSKAWRQGHFQVKVCTCSTGGAHAVLQDVMLCWSLWCVHALLELCTCSIGKA